jgi:hypothetical protein
VRWCEVAQQLLLAQHPGLHAVGPGVFVTKQGTAGNRTVAVKSPNASPTDMAVLLIIGYWIA